MIKKLCLFFPFVFFLIHFFLPPDALAGENEDKGGPKEKYKIIGDINEAGRVRPVEVVKYFNYSCSHCYRFFQGEGQLLKRFGSEIRYSKVPIFWGKQTPYPAAAYYYALKNGKGEEINKAIFEAHFEKDLDVFDLKVLSVILQEHGLPVSINGEDWVKSKELRDQVEAGMQAADRYDVRETPSIVINGVIKVMPEHTGGDMPKILKRVEEAVVDLPR
ncbi:MAG: thioredoxin domain-containing protein [Nitrospinae bacterium]|nr:thioredoxin domain-containing protein [Nitrospinota bacterium]